MKLITIKLLIVAVLMFAATSAFADYSYDLNVNTSSVAGLPGYMDIQFDPGISHAAATAAITYFNSDALLTSPAALSGGAAGQLPAAVTINNTTGYNDYFQAVTFGNTMDLGVHVTGAGANSSSFALSFLDSAQANALLTNDQVNGYATVINGTPNGPVVTNNSSQTVVTATPIPAAAYLFGSGLMGLVGIRRKMKN